MHILSPVTDNCSSWISRRERMVVEFFSWPNLNERMFCRTWGSNGDRPHTKRMRIRSSYRALLGYIDHRLLYKLKLIPENAFSGTSLNTLIIYNSRCLINAELVDWVLKPQENYDFTVNSPARLKRSEVPQPHAPVLAPPSVRSYNLPWPPKPSCCSRLYACNPSCYNLHWQTGQ